MKYRDIAFANIKKGIRGYLSYYLSGSFCIAMFFIFLTLIFNEKVNATTQEYPLTLYFIVSVVSILLFSIFFISYTHYSFIKNRHKEFGVLITSGMSSRDLNKMLFIEMSILLGLSLVTGLITGSLFANLVQLIVVNLLDIEANTSITFSSYLVTIGVFILLYGVIFIFSLISINKMDISALIKVSRKKDMSSVKPYEYVLAILGFLFTVVSIILVLTKANDNSVNTSPLFMISYLSLTLLGLIFIANYGLKSILGLTHKTKIYKQNLLAISQMELKFHSNRKIILVLSIMATLIVLSVGAPTALLSLTDDIVVEGTSDLEYLVEDGKDDSIKDIIAEHVQSKEEYSYIFADDINKIIISEGDYNKWNNNTISLNNDECMNVITSWEPGDHGISVNSILKINNNAYKVISSEKGFFFSNNLSYSDSVICVSDEAYSIIEANTLKGHIYKVSYNESYQNTKELDMLIRENIEERNVSTRYFLYQSYKSGYSTFLFVSLTQSIMFFISTGFVLFFKQMNELNENKKEFNKLYKIGITDKEVSKVMAKQLRIVYFTPIILGAVFGFSIMYYMTNLFVVSSDASKFVGEFMKYGACAVLAYFLVQLALYYYNRIMYKRNVILN